VLSSVRDSNQTTKMSPTCPRDVTRARGKISDVTLFDNCIRLGLDVYDLTTGQVRSSSTDDIALEVINHDGNEVLKVDPMTSTIPRVNQVSPGKPQPRTGGAVGVAPHLWVR
jgi:hypothetical protein